MVCAGGVRAAAKAAGTESGETAGGGSGACAKDGVGRRFKRHFLALANSGQKKQGTYV